MKHIAIKCTDVGILRIRVSFTKHGINIINVNK